MLCDSDIQEELSIAYVQAIAAHAGFVVDPPHKDRDSVDLIVSAHGKVTNDSILRSPKLELQLKAHMIDMPEGDSFPFDLPIKNYHDLRENRALPALLVVFAMPRDKHMWLTHSSEHLITRDCAFWHNLKGEPDSTNIKTKTIYIQKCNHLSPHTLHQIMVKISKAEDLGYVL